MEKPLDHADLESFKPVREPRLGGAARHQSRLAIAALLLLTAYNQLGSKLQLSSWLPHTRPKHSLSTSAMSFYPCPDVTETLCAYHNVPLDYTNPMPNETVSLAIRVLPATAPSKDQLGYLFINPGGPGGSGTDLVVRAGAQLSKILQGRYHILGWDPRSVNLTSPSLSCFPTPGDGKRFARDIEHLGLLHEAADVPGTGMKGNASAASVEKWMTRVEAYARTMDQACADHASSVLRASSTSFVARDIKSMLEALGQDKLAYWGFSYGTILGATFAAMFPDLIGRMMLDGVSDAVLYHNSFLDWGRSGMDDTLKTYDGFLTNCAKAGPAGCALASNSSTAHELSRRVENLLAKLRREPVAVGSSRVGPGIVTASAVEYVIFMTMYAPKLWPATASAIAALEKGNGTMLFELSDAADDNLGRKTTENVFHRSMDTTTASTAAIMCGDTDHAAFKGTTVNDLVEYTKELKQKSPTGDIWSLWVTQCTRWRHKPIERYSGPWSVSDGLNKTNFPILFFSQEADPVTPLSAARAMVERFGPDSASLLIQDGFGHCSLAHPSLCTAKHARAYFTQGKVPESGSTCKSDPRYLFPTPNSKSYELDRVEHGDAELRTALEGLMDAVPRLLR